MGRTRNTIFYSLVCVFFLAFSILGVYMPGTAEVDAQDVSFDDTGLPRFTMEFREADIRDVLRLLALESGLNVIMGDDITGTVTVSFRDVSLKEALNAIFKTYNYGYQVVDNILIISTEKTAEFVTRQINVNYATNTAGSTDLNDLAEALRSLLSGREGSSITVINRTNTLLITDTPENVDKITSLTFQLDKKTPQVKIEARIVEVKDIFKKELGVQWGADFMADSAHGNALGTQFPNSINIGGTQEGGYLVNMPSTNATAGLGIQLGHIANTFALDLRLSAMEKLEKLNILSSPSILAIQNKQAIIKVGEQIPYEETNTEESGTSSTQVAFKDVALILQVTPHITSDNRIFMDVTLNKDTRGEVVIIRDKQDYAIDTKQISTKVLLKNEETAVIGGLYTQQKTQIDGSVPVLSKIPLLGWLFRSKMSDDNRSELLIFLTPRIVETL